MNHSLHETAAAMIVAASSKQAGSVAPQEVVLWPSKATVEAIASKLNANGCAAEPSQRNDRRRELGTRGVSPIGPAVCTETAPEHVHFTSGPCETFATRDEALAAGLAWRNVRQLP